MLKLAAANHCHRRFIYSCVTQLRNKRAAALCWRQVHLQTTVSKDVIFAGIGLHSGNPSTAIVKPAAINSGIRLIDLDHERIVPAIASSVMCSRLCTTLGDIAKDAGGGGRTASVRTVEHILSAMYATGITNAEIHVAGGEIPCLDGSALPFYKRLKPLLKQQAVAAAVICIEEVLEVRNNDFEFVRLEPLDVNAGERGVSKGGAMSAGRLDLDVTIEFDSPIGEQRVNVSVVDGDVTNAYVDGIAASPTFCFERDIQAMKSNGLALGGSLENAIVFSDHGHGGNDNVLNPNMWKRVDDPCRHKILDLIGDLSLCNARLHAKVVARRPGHSMTTQLVKKLLETRQARGNGELQR